MPTDILAAIAKIPKYFVYHNNSGWHVVKRLPQGRKGKGPFNNTQDAVEFIKGCYNTGH